MFGSFVKVSKKCQRPWLSGNGSVRRAVNSPKVCDSNVTHTNTIEQYINFVWCCLVLTFPHAETMDYKIVIVVHHNKVVRVLSLHPQDCILYFRTF